MYLNNPKTSLNDADKQSHLKLRFIIIYFIHKKTLRTFFNSLKKYLLKLERFYELRARERSEFEIPKSVTFQSSMRFLRQYGRDCRPWHSLQGNRTSVCSGMRSALELRAHRNSSRNWTERLIANLRTHGVIWWTFLNDNKIMET